MDKDTLIFSALTCGSIAVILGIIAVVTAFPFISGMACGVGVIALIDGLFAYTDRT